MNALTTPTTTTTTTSPTRQRRAGNAALWVLQVLTAAVFVFAALPKLGADAAAVAGFTIMGLGVVGMYVIGALELAGAFALLVPRPAGLAALAFVALMIGAVVATLLIGGAAMAAMPAFVGLVAAVIAWGRRFSTAELVALVRS